MKKKILLPLLLVPIVVGLLSLSRNGAGELAPGVRWSMLALGDTGSEPEALAMVSGAGAVARALASRHEAHPVQALALLGDNFYPTGLKERKFKERVRGNLVTPYCLFLDLTSRGHGSMADDCGVAEADRKPVPILAVLGNHDYKERESPMLQRTRIPEYIENWQMPEAASVYEDGSGVSVVSFQSMPVQADGSADPLREALAASKGPWRIILAHHPVVDPGQGFVGSYTKRVTEAIESSGVPVHVFLAGHEHNLQLLTGPGAALHVVAGSGSSVRELSDTQDERRFGLAELGFARVDLAGEGEDEHLQVSLLALESRVLGTAGTVAAYRVDADGSVRDLATQP